ncbi:MAG: CBS domain-containing protein [Candidatus Aenigmatarchaeota archaeon]
MQVKEIMNKNVVTISPDANLLEAAKKMVETNTKFLIVTEEERLVGIVTEWDIVKKISKGEKDVLNSKLRTMMTKKVIVISPDMEITEAAELMLENNIKRLPVVENNVLVGVVTAMELLAAEPKLVEQIAELFLTSGKQKSVAG